MRTLDELINSFGIDKLATTPHGWKGCCAINPEHIDSKPSMHIHVEKGIVKCFACGSFRTLFDFLLEKGATFDEAVTFMFTEYERKEGTGEGMKEWILGRKLPKSMLDRGFTKETLRHFGVGFDDVEWHITIPLRFKEILLGIGYRQHPKKFWYSDGFIKDNFIYNYEPTEIRTYTEGFTDTWRIFQNGTQDISALLTAFPSDGQLALMAQHKTINLALDNDEAGFKGAFKIHKELGREIDINCVIFKGKDAGEQTPEAWQKSIASPITFTEFEVKMIGRNPALYEKIKKSVYGSNY